MNRVITTTITCLMLAVSMTAHGQGSDIQWKRQRDPVQTELRLFHSTQVVNLPTAETIRGGLFQFEISHRFVPRISDGHDVLYGFDGPVNMCIGLGYAITDRLTATLARSNLQDNVDLQLKYKALGFRLDLLPVMIGFRAGTAWNTEVPGRDDGDSRNFQYYVQGIANTMLFEKLALGVVPSYLHNSIIESEDTEYAVTVGLYGQYYISSLLSLLAEWNITEAGYYYEYDAATFGIELETGGHFFKIVVSNSTRLNPSQFLVGANNRFKPDEWRVAFNITRLLKF